MELMDGVLISVGILVFFAAVIGIALMFRRVVATNEVHIVQSARATTSYGRGTGHGNTYFEWPAFLPILGVTKVILPVSNFDVDLKDYEAYDEGRLPFRVDVKAFFRIADSNEAAQRVASFEELQHHLTAVVQGSVRVVLATSTIEEIMQGRSKFGIAFTNEVADQLKSWGVETVKNIELMDIRDSQNSKVIANIMEKKKSQIEAESRIEVAKNHRNADIAEIEATRETNLKSEEAKQTVGLRQVEVNQQLQTGAEKSAQLVRDQQKLTKEKDMAILEIETVRKAEITKKQGLIVAEQNRQAVVIQAEGSKTVTTLKAEADLEAKRREAEGVAALGIATAESEKALLMAPVQAQVTLAKEIGQNKEYQQYLITVEQIKAHQAVGIAQAEALQDAEIKVIANSGSATGAINSLGDLFSSKGGTAVGAMLEGLKQSETGETLLSRFTGESKKK